MKSNSTSVIMTCILFLFLTTIVLSKEIEATKEWQTIGENDTVPAGAHIRMDMTTGEKWIKLLDDDDDDEEDGKKGLIPTTAVEIHSDGSTSALVIDNSSKESSDVETKTTMDYDYDYDMMHRTLSKLPNEEQERMGGLPELLPPVDRNAGIKKEDRVLFEKRMKEIWEQRQEELAKFQEDNVADLPGILKDRINRIKAYLENPYLHLVELHSESSDDAAEDDQPTDDDEGNLVVTNIVSVLQDLEYHLADLDMTRDFHTLGGWTPLVSLLSNEVHRRSDNNSNQDNTTNAVVLTEEEVETWVDVVQMNAAWVIGTALKNIGEFFPYAIEPVVVVLEKKNSGETSALELLLAQFVEAPSQQKKRQKMIYALGALLRGNREAQLTFLEIEGPKRMARVLEKELLNDHDDAVLTKRILALLGDIVFDNDVEQQGEEGEQHDDDGNSIVNAIACPSVCQSSLKSLTQSSKVLRETAVRTFDSLIPYCKDWDMELALSLTVSVKKNWQVDPNLDPEIRRDLLDLIAGIIKKLRHKQGK